MSPEGGSKHVINLRKIMKILEGIAFALVLVAAVLHLWLPQVAPYVMSVGAAGVAIAHFAERYEGSNLRLRRNNRTRHLIGVIYVAAAYFMFRPYNNYWFLALLVAIVTELYTLHVMESEEKKVSGNANKNNLTENKKYKK